VTGRFLGKSTISFPTVGAINVSLLEVWMTNMWKAKEKECVGEGDRGNHFLATQKRDVGRDHRRREKPFEGGNPIGKSQKGGGFENQ